MRIATNIEWDIDLEDGEAYEEVKEKIGLPDKIMIPENTTDEDEISDYVSEVTGFCHYGFEVVSVPIISKELADKLVKSAEINLELFELQLEEMSRMSFLELREFVRNHCKSIMGTGVDNVENRLSINFQINSILSACIYQNMKDNTVYIGDYFGIWDEHGKPLGFFDAEQINFMLKHAYEEFLKNAATIEYKGIVFDNWTVDEETGLIYGEMCEYCAEKYKDILNEELSDGGMGACSVKGCNIVGMDVDTNTHYYVDFTPELIHIHERKEGTANE